MTSILLRIKREAEYNLLVAKKNLEDIRMLYNYLELFDEGENCYYKSSIISNNHPIWDLNNTIKSEIITNTIKTSQNNIRKEGIGYTKEEIHDLLEISEHRYYVAYDMFIFVTYSRNIISHFKDSLEFVYGVLSPLELIIDIPNKKYIDMITAGKNVKTEYEALMLGPGLQKQNPLQEKYILAVDDYNKKKAAWKKSSHQKIGQKIAQFQLSISDEIAKFKTNFTLYKERKLANKPLLKGILNPMKYLKTKYLNKPYTKIGKLYNKSIKLSLSIQKFFIYVNNFDKFSTTIYASSKWGKLSKVLFWTRKMVRLPIKLFGLPFRFLTSNAFGAVFLGISVFDCNLGDLSPYKAYTNGANNEIDADIIWAQSNTMFTSDVINFSNKNDILRRQSELQLILYNKDKTLNKRVKDELDRIKYILIRAQIKAGLRLALNKSDDEKTGTCLIKEATSPDNNKKLKLPFELPFSNHKWNETQQDCLDYGNIKNFFPSCKPKKNMEDCSGLLCKDNYPDPDFTYKDAENYCNDKNSQELCDADSVCNWIDLHKLNKENPPEVPCSILDNEVSWCILGLDSYLNNCNGKTRWVSADASMNVLDTIGRPIAETMKDIIISAEEDLQKYITDVYFSPKVRGSFDIDSTNKIDRDILYFNALNKYCPAINILDNENQFKNYLEEEDDVYPKTSIRYIDKSSVKYIPSMIDNWTPVNKTNIPNTTEILTDKKEIAYDTCADRCIDNDKCTAFWISNNEGLCSPKSDDKSIDNRCSAVKGEDLYTPTVCEAVTIDDDKEELACGYTPSFECKLYSSYSNEEYEKEKTATGIFADIIRYNDEDGKASIANKHDPNMHHTKYGYNGLPQYLISIGATECEIKLLMLEDYKTNGYTLYENTLEFGNYRNGDFINSNIGIHGNGCVGITNLENDKKLTVEDAIHKCNESDDCNGFFTFDSKSESKVCFKNNIDINKEKKEFNSNQFPNSGMYVKSDDYLNTIIVIETTNSYNQKIHKIVNSDFTIYYEDSYIASYSTEGDNSILTQINEKTNEEKKYKIIVEEKYPEKHSYYRRGTGECLKQTICSDEEYIDGKYENKEWSSDLSQNEKDDWYNLCWDETRWINSNPHYVPEHCLGADVEYYTWDKLNDTQKDSATRLGYNEVSWNCTSTTLTDNNCWDARYNPSNTDIELKQYCYGGKHKQYSVSCEGSYDNNILCNKPSSDANCYTGPKRYENIHNLNKLGLEYCDNNLVGWSLDRISPLDKDKAFSSGLKFIGDKIGIDEIVDDIGSGITDIHKQIKNKINLQVTIYHGSYLEGSREVPRSGSLTHYMDNNEALDPSILISDLKSYISVLFKNKCNNVSAQRCVTNIPYNQICILKATDYENWWNCIKDKKSRNECNKYLKYLENDTTLEENGISNNDEILIVNSTSNFSIKNGNSCIDTLIKTTTQTSLIEPDIDCTGSWSNCTNKCETANERIWTEITPQSGQGTPCPAAKKCFAGEDDCPNIREQITNLPQTITQTFFSFFR